MKVWIKWEMQEEKSPGQLLSETMFWLPASQAISLIVFKLNGLLPGNGQYRGIVALARANK